jgi:hypothetical protein
MRVRIRGLDKFFTILHLNKISKFFSSSKVVIYLSITKPPSMTFMLQALLSMFLIFALLYPDPDLRFPSAGPDPADQNLMQFHADPEPQH